MANSKTRAAWGVGAGAVVVAGIAAVLVLGVPISERYLGIDALLPAGYSATHDLAWYHPLSGATTFSNLRVTDANGQAAVASRVAVSGYARRDDGDHFESLDLRDLHLTVSGQPPLTVARLTAHGFAFDPTPAPGEPAWRAVLRRTRIGSLHIGQLALAAQFPGTGYGAVGGAIVAIDIRDYDHGAVGDIAFTDFALHAASTDPAKPTFAMAVHSAEVQNFQAVNLDRMAIYRLGVPALLKLITPGRPETWLVTGTSVSMGSVFSMSIATTRMSAAYKQVADAHGRMEMRGCVMHITPPVFSRSAPMLQATGLDGAALSADSESDFTKATLSMQIRATTSAAQIGTLAYSIAYHVDPQLLDDPSHGVVLDGARLQWDDAGLFDRLVALFGTQHNLPPDLARARMEQAAARVGAMVPAQADFGAQLSAFVAQPHRLVLTIDPPCR